MLEQVAAERVIGSATPEHLSVMGYQERSLAGWRDKTAQELVARLREEAAGGLILAPAWPDGCANVPVLARWIERAGISTVVVTMMPAVPEERLAPRVVGVE